jgi:hypothetical protein
VIENYTKFLKTILSVLRRRKEKKVCNIFTTNYDGCIAHIADDIIKSGTNEFILNDGTRGFFRRYLHARNYNAYTLQSGVFDRYSTEIPQINLIHMHGSVYWRKEANSILVDYTKTYPTNVIDNLIPDIRQFSTYLRDETKVIEDLKKLNIPVPNGEAFWKEYKSFPVVNPTKWKFHETVFEEHYYQMLRHLSYELEKQNSVLISFGFSFADEHILNLVKRSLSNPHLQVFLSCFNKDEYESLVFCQKSFSEWVMPSKAA